MRTKAPSIPTGFPELDKVLGIGGIPRCRITEILGAPTSGVSTLALKIISASQGMGDVAVYVDLGRTFDPGYAVRCGVDMGSLYLVRPGTGREALGITQALVDSGGVGTLVFDSIPHLLRGSLRAGDVSAVFDRLNVLLHRSPCTPIFLTPHQFGRVLSVDKYPGGGALPHYATIRLLVEKERWIRGRRDIRGYHSRVGVLKNKLGQAGKTAMIAITFDAAVNGDGT
jgi:recombination protein RecA